MFKKALYTIALILLLTGNANAHPLKNFSGPSYIEQTSEFFNNITKNWTDLPIGEIIITYILEHKEPHLPKIIFQDDEKDITLKIHKQDGQLFPNNDFCTVFELQISNKTGKLDTHFSSLLCLNSINQTSSFRIRALNYTID